MWGLCACVLFTSCHVMLVEPLQSGSLSRSCCGITVPLAFAFLCCVMSTSTTTSKPNQDGCHENNGICGALPCWWTRTSQCSVTWIERRGRHVSPGVWWCRVHPSGLRWASPFRRSNVCVQDISAKAITRRLNEVRANLTLLMASPGVWSLQLCARPQCEFTRQPRQ